MAVGEGSQLHPKCLGDGQQAKRVTHYMVPILKSFEKKTCEVMEGTCLFEKSGTPYIYSVGHGSQPLATARCKNGWGNKSNCLHPCRVLAASMDHHTFGQIVFIKDLVGKRCGSRARDGFEIVHDGFMMVADTGSSRHFNAPGRFDFFWGPCERRAGGECLEGAIPISEALTKGDFCTVWDPKTPERNSDVKNAFVSAVSQEAKQRGDEGAAQDILELEL